MPITSEKAQITSQNNKKAFFNICHADTTGVMVWGTQSRPTLLSLGKNGFDFIQQEDERAMNFWLDGIEESRNFRIMNDSIYELAEGEQREMIAVSEEAQANIEEIKAIFPDFSESQIIERALEMMAVYWKH